MPPFFSSFLFPPLPVLREEKRERGKKKRNFNRQKSFHPCMNRRVFFFGKKRKKKRESRDRKREIERREKKTGQSI
ncbi:hypothetical protein BSKO_09149 [Bryopsis sp. KO-2023]|nr:hypothetical protein BSKO_09149 [Bryopsis sp. KO-2023]